MQIYIKEMKKNPKHYENVFPSKYNTWLFIPDVIY